LGSHEGPNIYVITDKQTKLALRRLVLHYLETGDHALRTQNDVILHALDGLLRDKLVGYDACRRDAGETEPKRQQAEELA